jgi:thioredoxin-related protein
MLDTCDYVPEKYNNKIGKYIFKNMKRHFKLIDREDRKFQKKLKDKLKSKESLNKSKKEKWQLFKKLFRNGLLR